MRTARTVARLRLGRAELLDHLETRPGEALAFEPLGGRVVDLEDAKPGAKVRTPEREGVEAGAGEHVLGDATRDRRGELVLGVARAEQYPCVRGRRVHGGVERAGPI